MKKILLLLLLAGTPAFAQSIQFTWTAENSSLPACSTTVTTSCIAGYTITDVTTASSPVVLSSTIAAAASSYTYALPELTAASSRTYGIFTDAKDSSGNSDPSTQVTAVVAVPEIPPAPVTGFGGSTSTTAALRQPAAPDAAPGTAQPVQTAFFRARFLSGK